MTGSKKVMAEQLAEFVVGLRYGDLSAEVVELGQDGGTRPTRMSALRVHS